jgi:hypothetical protein
VKKKKTSISFPREPAAVEVSSRIVVLRHVYPPLRVFSGGVWEQTQVST